MTTVRQMFAERIRARREYLGLTQEELAKLVGSAGSTISNYERGERIMGVEDLPAMAKALRVPVSYFYGDDEESAREDFIRYYEGAPPMLQEAALRMLKSSFVEDDADETTHGRKAEG